MITLTLFPNSAHNGPECTSKALDLSAYERGVELAFIRPGKPIENCLVESFNGRFRDECLNVHWFLSLLEADDSPEFQSPVVS